MKVDQIIIDAYLNGLKTGLEGVEKSTKFWFLFELIQNEIVKGNIPNNLYLPSSRQLATQLDLSRSTVNRSYELLVNDGLIVSEPGRGYRVVNTVEESQIAIGSSTVELEQFNLSKTAQSFLREKQNYSNQDYKELAFRVGVPPVDVFPINRWMKLTSEYWKGIQFSSMNYQKSSGEDDLKNTLSKYLRVSRNLHCDPKQIVIVSGSLQSLYLLANVFINEGDSVWLENPTFQNVISVFRGVNSELHGLEIDTDGAVIPNEYGKIPKLIHCTPNCQFPLGTMMSDSRKNEWIDFCQINDSYIIENDYEHEIVSQSSASNQTLYSLDSNQRTIYLSTFNRILHPSIRLGFMVVPHSILPAVEALMNFSHRFVAPSIQTVLNEFIKKSHLQRHIEQTVKTANERKRILLPLAQELFPDWTFCDTPALHVNAFWNPTRGNAEFLEGLAAEHIAVQSIEDLYLNATVLNQDCGFANFSGMVLGFSCVPPSVGIQKLQTMHEIRKVNMRV